MSEQYNACHATKVSYGQVPVPLDSWTLEHGRQRRPVVIRRCFSAPRPVVREGTSSGASNAR